MPKTRMVITVEGGIIQGITHDNEELKDMALEVCVLDFDCDGNEDAKEINLYYQGLKAICNIYKEDAGYNKDFVEHYFKEMKKE
jgi:hypothetical protein